MRETEPTLMVNWYEVEIFDTAKNKVIYKNSFITNHKLNQLNYVWFQSWNDLLIFILTEGESREPVNTS